MNAATRLYKSTPISLLRALSLSLPPIFHSFLFPFSFPFSHRIGYMRITTVAVPLLAAITVAYAGGDEYHRHGHQHHHHHDNDQHTKFPDFKECEAVDDRAKQIKDAFLHAYNGYREYAWGADELLPLTNKPSNSR